MATDLFTADKLTADGNLTLANLRAYAYGEGEWHQVVIPAAGLVLPAALGGGTTSFGGGTAKLQLFFTKLNAWIDAVDPTTGSTISATAGPCIWPIAVMADDYRVNLAGSTTPVLPVLWR